LSGATLNKGFDVLVEAVGLLADLDVEWCLFTNLDSKKADQRLVAAAKGYTNVTPVGHVSDVAVAYSQVDIVFVPSRRESFGRVAAEAMLNGLPVVATDIPAMRRVVGDAGLLFAPGDAGAAADQIRAVVIDPELRARINQMAPIRARAFDPDRVRGALDLLYGAT
jgi:phosphatidylinositol alpha-mannosyltransferase